MKFFNLSKKLRNSALAILFAVAVMFVMPATAFADDTDVIDNGIVNNVEFENGIENNNNIDSTIDYGSELPTVNEDFVDFTEAVEPEITDPLIPIDNCYHICCDICDEYCDGTCCDMCTIINDAHDINVPDNFEYGFGNEFAGTDVPANIGNETGNTEEGNLGNFNNEIVVAPTDEFTNSNENVIPVVPSEPIFPDDYYNVIIPENPEDVYQPEVGNEPTDGDLIGDTDKDLDNEKEIIYDDDNDLIGEEEEIISGDDDLTDDENSETSNDSDSKNSDNESGEENSDNSDGENADNTTDEENENNDNSDSENFDNAEDKENPDNSDNENSNNITDVEISDSSNSDNSDDITDDNDPDYSDNAADEENNDNSDEENSDNTTDEENPDDSDSEALEEDDNPIISVVLPASLSVVINPYNLNVDESGFHYSISSPEYSIKNYSNCDVSIIATASASTDGGIVLSPYDLTGNETEFTAFAYIEATSESGVYSNNYSNSANQLVFSNEAVSKEILMLADGSNGETTGYFKIVGRAVLPDGAQYSAQAMLNMVITFDIDPVINSVASDNAAEEETENVENVESSENVENTENVENIENFENVENTESSENIENVQELAA